MERILIIRGKSQYDSTMIFLDEMKEEWERLGICVDVLDSYQEEAYLKQRELIRDTFYDVVVTINGMLLEKESALGKLLLKDSVLYATMLMDHPLIHHERLITSYPNCLVLSPDRRHVKYLEQYYPNIKNVGFLAHGGCQAKKIIPYGERSIEVSFMGSYRPPEEIWGEMGQYPQQMKMLLENCANYLQYHTEATLEEAVQNVFLQFGVEIPVSEFADIVSEFRIVDHYIRCYYRDQVIRMLVDNGITVDVYGDGWEKMQVSNKSHLRIHGKVEYQESLEIVADSKISLNVMPWFKEGSHDRVFSAMLCGAICVTDASEYLKETCQNQENILFYDLENLKQLPEMVSAILEDNEKGKRIALAGKELAENLEGEKKHTWAQRAKEIYQMLERCIR